MRNPVARLTRQQIFACRDEMRAWAKIERDPAIVADLEYLADQYEELASRQMAEDEEQDNEVNVSFVTRPY